ncbi:MCE family protein [Nocardioides sp. C4-1]|uniref:MCE family protein n=1 Tax=Nocardioides sp. C4-1 TaxID=3151851 RepID=UPI0032673FDA
MKRLVRGLVAVVVGSVLLSGCDFDVYQLPLPGGTDVGSDPMKITVQFDNVLDLVPQSSVKVNDVNVGKVSSVELDGYTAEVEIEIRNDVDLPENATATIRQTSLLGEKFVSLAPPAEGARGRLADGDEITLDSTGQTPEVEQVLGALSLLLNNGGLDKVRTITREVNAALSGREDSVKSLLDQVASFMGQLDANKADIVDAIESLNQLAIGVRRQQPKIDLALEELPSAVLSLDRQRDDLVTMLDKLDRLSDVGVRVIRRSKENTIVSVRQLQPILGQLAAAGDALVDSFNVALTYPFVDEAVGRDPQVARNLHMGDYTNLSINLQLDLTGELPGIPCTPLEEIPQVGPLPDFADLCADAQDALAACIDTFNRACLAGLVDSVCENTPSNPICDILGGLVGPQGPLGGLGGLGGNGGNGNGGNGGLLPLDIPGLPGALSGIGGLLNRPGLGAADQPSGSGPTVGELMAVYDPALVSLLTPGMVTQ